MNGDSHYVVVKAVGLAFGMAIGLAADLAGDLGEKDLYTWCFQVVYLSLHERFASSLCNV